MSLKVAVVAAMFNEEAMLPYFLSHYSRFCDKIVLWDNGSTDRSVSIAKACPKADVRYFHSFGYDELSCLRVFEGSLWELSGYDWVMFPDIDEFLVAKDHGLERGALESAGADILVADGYCLVERDGEPPLDLSVPISRQRQWGYWSLNYSKPIIVRPKTDFKFIPGKHAAAAAPGVTSERYSRFYLIHAEMVSKKLWMYRKNRRRLSDLNLKHGWSFGTFCRPRHEHELLWAEILAWPLLKIPAGNWGEYG